MGTQQLPTVAQVKTYAHFQVQKRHKRERLKDTLLLLHWPAGGSGGASDVAASQQLPTVALVKTDARFQVQKRHEWEVDKKHAAALTCGWQQ